ncbi:MAG: ABC transporter permease [Candidatus Thermoplasmatota archaeon]|jgi:ABC-2 type transport system permease protein/oleandomycin transport system permease protein
MTVATRWQRFGWSFSDTWLVTWRNLMFFARNPYWIMIAVIQPIMFTLLFVFVFGGAIALPGDLSYADYAIPGIIIQTVVFSSLGSGINIADDMQKGVMDRYRSLPIGRGVVLTARTVSDLVRNFGGAMIMAGVGFAVGYRFHGSWLDGLAAIGLCLAFGYAFSWIAATIGLISKTTQTAEVAGFTWAFPVVFASSIFVPVESMPGWLQAFAEVNPVTLASDAVRHLSLNQPVGNDAWLTLAWCAGLVVVFRFLAVWRFRRLA